MDSGRGVWRNDGTQNTEAGCGDRVLCQNAFNMKALINIFHRGTRSRNANQNLECGVQERES